MKTGRCPTCKTPVNAPTADDAESARFFPFCSQRCKLIDLGAWLDCRYRISTSTEQAGAEGERPERLSRAQKAKKRL